MCRCACTHARMCVCGSVCVHVLVHVSVHVRACLRMCMCGGVCVWGRERACALSHVMMSSSFILSPTRGLFPTRPHTHSSEDQTASLCQTWTVCQGENGATVVAKPKDHSSGTFYNFKIFKPPRFCVLLRRESIPLSVFHLRWQVQAEHSVKKRKKGKMLPESLVSCSWPIIIS